MLFLVVAASALVAACEQPVAPQANPSLSFSPSFSARALGGPPSGIVFHSARSGVSHIYLMDADGGEPQAVAAGTGSDLWPDISRNGHLVTFMSNRSGNNEIYVLDLSDDSLWNVSNNAGATNNDDNWPRFSPNGKRIAFHSNRSGNYEIYT
ncbi:MAG: TolB family protein, partial [Gemmatimonadales bacterium]